MKQHKNNIITGIFTLLMLMFCMNLSAQNITAGGVVVDVEQQPLIGVTISVGNGKAEAVTNIDGKFSLQCPDGAILSVSYVGYTTRRVHASKEMRIVMEEDAKTLDEVTVVGVGYGKMRKSDLTGAIASVSAKNMKQGVITSTEQLLQGKVAGLSVVQSSGAVESGSTIRLRGGTSLSASNGPLVVVDGIPGVDINSVQPNEILSMDVLKDASAAAIYGSRGANGVIIVTTNREASNTEINTMQYNGYVAVSSVARKLDLLSANQWRSYARSTGNMAALDYGADTDWQGELERTGISHGHNFSFSSFKKDHGYRTNLSYTNNEGVIKRNNMNRLAGSLSAYQTGLKSRLRLEEGINANFDSWHPVDTRIFERMCNLQPTFPVYNQDGSYAQLNGTNTENPVELNNNRIDDQKRHRFLGYAKADLNIADGLTATVNTSYEYNSVKGGLYKPTYARMEGQSEKGWGQRTYSDYVNKQLELYLTYDKKLGAVHHLNLMVGYSYLDNTYEGFGATRSGFDTNAFGYNNLAAGTDFRQGDVYSDKGESKLISFFGRVNYSLLDRYMITATVRDDGSSRFGDNHKWGIFPSVSLAWRISEEPFMKGTRSWLDNMKLRLGFGVTGNQNGIGEYKSLSILSASGAAYYDGTTGTWKNSYTQIQNVNPDLKWESTAQWNLGIDFALLNRLTGTLELDEAYAKVDNRPLLPDFGPQGMTSSKEWYRSFAVLATKPFFMVLDGHSNLCNDNTYPDNAQGEYSWVNPLPNYASAKNFKFYIGGAMPGFHDFYKEGGSGDGYTTYDSEDGALFKRQLDAARKASLSWLQISTWNDYGEGTTIEPTREYGYRYLVALQEFTGVTYRQADLELIYQWYLAKIKNPDSQQVKEAYDALVKLDTEKARQLLNVK